MQTDGYSSTATEGSPEEVKRKAEQTAQTVVDQAQQVASTQANVQMNRAAQLLDGVAQSLHQTGQDMRAQQPQIASVADQAAGRVEDASNYLRDKDLNGVIRDAENYARREPLIFVGAAFAVGFIAARFLKASSPGGDFGRQYGNSRSSLAGYSGGSATGYGRYEPDYATEAVGSSWSGGSAATPSES
jgi:ElaB/YqjD/DUF883 family membrane-anchored ribosome-binding protein